MAPRLQLQSLLEALTPHVYFQPPTNLKLEYPCIVYKLSGNDAKHADNQVYRITRQYEVTLITRNPDDALWYGLIYLPYCSFDRHFTADDLNHEAFTLYF